MSIPNDDTTTNIFIGLFSVLLFIGISNGLKVKNYLKINILIIKITQAIIK